MFILDALKSLFGGDNSSSDQKRENATPVAQNSPYENRRERNAKADKYIKRTFQKGDEVVGTYKRINEGGILIDIGSYYDAFLPGSKVGITRSEWKTLLGKKEKFIVADKGSNYTLRRKSYQTNNKNTRRLEKQRQEQKLPWAPKFDVGATVRGTVKELVKGGVLVEVNGWNAFMPGSEVGMSNRSEWSYMVGNEYDFEVVESDSRNLVLSRKKYLMRLSEEPIIFTQSEEVLTVTSLHGNNYAFTEPFKDFVAGVLPVTNIFCKGAPVPFETACFLLKMYKESGQRIGFEVLGEKKSQNGIKYAILTKNYSTLIPISDEIFYSSLKVGKECLFKVVRSTSNFKVLRMQGRSLWGIASREAYNRSPPFSGSTYVSLPIVSLPNSPCLPMILGESLPKHIVVDRCQQRDRERRLNTLFTELEQEHLNDQDEELINNMLEVYPEFGATRTREDDISQEILIVDSDLTPEKLADLNAKIGKSTFWVNCSFRENSNRKELTIYNEKGIALLAHVDDDTIFSLDRWSDEKKVDRLLDAIIKRTRKNVNLKIDGRNVIITSRYEAKNKQINAGEVWLYVNRRIEYLIIKSNVLKRVDQSIQKRAIDFSIQLNSLEYQIEKSNRKEDVEVRLSPNQIHPITAKGQGESFALRLDLTDDQLNDFFSDDGFARVYSLNNDGKRKDTGELTYSEKGGAIWRVIGQNKNLAEYLESGVTLRGDANARHLILQKNAIDQFIKGFDGDSLLKKLVGDSIPIPNIGKLDGLEFFDNNLKTVEDGNNQPEAVKKAISLDKKGILLIQGPPGTGKTTVIIEIIKQLVINHNKKVLICSQSHAAVDNIDERINDKRIDKLRIGNEEESARLLMDTYGQRSYIEFIENNQRLLQLLRKDSTDTESINKLLEQFKYDDNSNIAVHFSTAHNYIVKYYNKYKHLNEKDLDVILDQLKDNAEEVSSEALQEQYYSAKDVILGTCIGVGMDRVLKKGHLHFDVLIIDEAAKANFAETLVPMRLADSYVLVGDDNQLPPYIDRESIDEMFKEMTAKKNIESDDNMCFSKNELMEAQGKSLFEYFHYHCNPPFPDECVVTLNYQYRMNPEIGQFISDLFYDKTVNNGQGTEREFVDIEGFDTPVTVWSTANYKDKYEKQTPTNSYYNECEASCISEEILPRILPTLERNPDYTLGIITPYASQRDHLQSKIDNPKISECIYTIDSIQGSEFDIVIFSFVRSFKEKKKKVGFIDDMRRLNVSLSRAKKKLIIVGDMETLTRKSSHFNISGDINPVDVFEKLGEKSVANVHKATNIERFYQSKHFSEGEIIKGCRWEKRMNRKSEIAITFSLSNDDMITLPMKVTPSFFSDTNQDEELNIRYIGQDKNSRPQFGFAELRDEILYTTNKVSELFKIKEKGIDQGYIVESIENGTEVSIRIKQSLILGEEYYLTRNVGKDRFFMDLDKSFKYISDQHEKRDKVEGLVYMSKKAKLGNYQNTIVVRGLLCTVYTDQPLQQSARHLFNILYVRENERNKMVTLKLISKS